MIGRIFFGEATLNVCGNFSLTIFSAKLHHRKFSDLPMLSVSYDYIGGLSYSREASLDQSVDPNSGISLIPETEFECIRSTNTTATKATLLNGTLSACYIFKPVTYRFASRLFFVFVFFSFWLFLIFFAFIKR